MPYTGFGFKHGNNRIVVKVHGPQDHVDINTQEVRDFAKGSLEFVDRINNFPATCKILAQMICDKFCNGSDKIWVQVDIETNYDLMYGASAEKILV